MSIFKKKNYLKRSNLINSVNSSKIQSKKMTISEIKQTLVVLELEISKHEFDLDKNFIMNSRRKTLKKTIEERLQKNDNVNETISESLFNFYKFISNEYSEDFISISKELNISIQELTKKDNKYRKKGIICLQEKEIILEIIQKIKEKLKSVNIPNKNISIEKIEEIIKNIQKTFSIELPKDYIKYMKSHNGYTGFINENYYNIWKLEEIIPLNNDYQVQEFFPNIIYFGSNGSGEALAFDKSNNMCIVSIPFIGTEKDKITIASNFNNFIKKENIK